MLDPQKILPRYGWEKPPISNNSNGRWPIPPLPTHISKVKENGNRNKRHRLLNPWQYLAALIEPIYWFRASLEWYKSDPTQDAGDDITTTSFAELTIAFQFVTGINPCVGRHDDPEKTTLTDRMHIFNSATKALELMVGAKLHPGKRVQDTDALVRERFKGGPGVEGRPNFPLWKHYTAIWLRAHIELPINTKNGAPRTLKWVPNFDHKPAPVWKPGAPCGFEAAAKHLSKYEAMMRHGRRSSLMFREWKIARQAPPSGKRENCFIAPQMKNVATLSLECKINFENNLAPSRTKIHNTKEDKEATNTAKKGT